MAEACTSRTRSRVVWLSVGAGFATLALKGLAYLLTGSVGLLSDAAESLINILAALTTLVTLRFAERPPDETHHYGHEKAEYFSSGLEGGLILIAALAILYTAVRRLLAPQPLHDLSWGLAVALLAALINAGVARLLLHVAEQEDSIALEAEARHLLSDVWTSVGVVLGVGMVALTGWYVLDPLVAIAVALNILRMGVSLAFRSVAGLMDTALPPEDLRAIHEAIVETIGPNAAYHALRTRKAGPRRFVDFHLLVPGEMTVQESHDLAEAVEKAIQARLPNTQVTIHVEPLEDKAAWDEEKVGGITVNERPHTPHASQRDPR